MRVVLDDVESPDAKPFMDGLSQRGCGYEGFQPKPLSIDVPPEVRLEEVTLPHRAGRPVGTRGSDQG
ncbi:DUF4265 domain-containing protein [Corallococcus interemptor]|uniref:DUF4265 domain-containing protein n=1 Tax=Corallococcus interemptor TaxID=2316720 RepID=UPI0035D42B2E